MAASVVISIPDGEGALALKKENKKFKFSHLPFISFLREKKKIQFSLPPIVSFLREKKRKHDLRKVIHSFKVGTALVLVSLLYLLDPLFGHVGENAMWAIMTVVVIFEFFAGLFVFAFVCLFVFFWFLSCLSASKML
jgi:hypothetical protein